MVEPRELPSGREPEPGWTVRHYEILSEIGRGGMGILFRARNRALGSEVALKCPRPELAGDVKLRQRFLREAQAAARLSHPNVVPVIDAFEEGGIPWIVEELIDGQSLRALLTTTGGLPAETTVRYGECIADALAAAHAKRILHRDVKPNNILVTADDRVLLTDFGLAYVLPRGQVENDATTELGSLTPEGQIVGTPQYMAPEQAKGQTVDERTDLFSLGLVLYEMCTGVAAFRGGELGHVLDAIMHREPEPISRFTYEIPAELERIIRKAIAKRPDERYQSAKDMVADLRSLRRKLEFESYSGTQEEEKASWFDRVREWMRRKPILGVLVGSVVLSGFAVWGAWHFHLFQRTITPLTLSHPIQITSTPAWERDPAISPDGTRVAYVSNASGNSDIWVSDTRGGPSLRLTDDPATDTDPAWLPDGSQVLFASDRGGKYGIWKIPQLGGPAIQVVEGGMDPAVSPDGARLAFSHFTKSGITRIAVMAFDHPDVIKDLTGDADGLWDHMDPAWSPDGRTICYATLSNLWLVPSGGGKARRFTQQGVVDARPVWSPDGHSIYFCSLREGLMALWRASVPSGRVDRITLGSAEEGWPSLSADGKHLAYATREAEYRICIRDRRTGKQSEIKDLRGIMPALAPDGSALVFVSDRWGSNLDLWSQPLSGVEPTGPPRRLTEGPGDSSHPVFSPDGKWIAYYRILDGNRDIWVLPSQGGAPARITNDSAADIHPAWSPHGDRLAFSSDRNGHESLWTIGVANGHAVGEPISYPTENMMAHAPAWSPDGSAIAFLGTDADGSHDVWIAAAGIAPQRITQGVNAVRVRWDGDSKHLLVSGFWSSEWVTLRRVSMDGTSSPFNPEVVFGFDTREAFFDVTPDGRILAWLRSEPLGDIWTASVH